MTKTLKQRAVRSGTWVIFGHLLSQGLRLGSNLVLTRLLVPEMFGVMAIVTVIMGGLAMFSDVGLLQNIVQSKRGEDPDYLNTAWTIQIIRGFLIFLFALLLSVALHFFGNMGVLSVGTVYGNPDLPLFLAVVSMRSIVAGFNSIHILLLNRRLMLGKLTVVELISQVAGLIFMLSWAWFQRDIWALIYGGFVSVFLKLILSHSMNLGERCRIHWDKQAVYEIIHFGKWVFGASVFTFFAGQGDRIILGGLITSNELGVYSVAFFLAMAFKGIVRKIISSVFYPVLSEVVRERPQELKRIFYKIRSNVDSLIMVVVGLLASTGHVIVEFLYDDRYQYAGWVFEVLVLSTVFLGITIAGSCLLALGDSKSVMQLTAASSIFLFISLPIAFHYFGFRGAVIAIALNAIVELPILFYKMKQYDFLDWAKELRFWPLFVLSYSGGICGTSLLGI